LHKNICWIQNILCIEYLPLLLNDIDRRSFWTQEYDILFSLPFSKLCSIFLCGFLFLSFNTFMQVYRLHNIVNNYFLTLKSFLSSFFQLSCIESIDPLYRYSDLYPCVVVKHMFSTSLSLMLNIIFAMKSFFFFSCARFLWVSPFQTLDILVWNVLTLCCLKRLSSSYQCFPSYIRNFLLKISFDVLSLCT